MSRLPSVVSGDSRPGSPGASSFPVPVLLRTDYNPATIKRRRLSADTVRTMSAHHHRLLSVRLLLGLFCSLGLALTTAVLPAPAADAARQTEKRVVILYSHPHDFPATEMTERGIREAFAREGRLAVQLFSEYLDLSRFRDPAQRAALTDLFRQRYAANRIDLLISVDVPATNFLVEHGATLFPGVPVILCSVPEPLKDRILASPLGGRVSGVLEPASQARSLVRSALTLKPDTRHAVLISGTFENDQARAIALRAALEALRPGVELIDLSGRPLGDILAACEQLPPHTVIFFSTLFVDGRGRSFVPKTVLQSIAAQTAAPVFGPYEPFMGHGIVGGPLISLHKQGQAAARKALRLLLGEEQPGAAFDSGEGTSVTLYDWRQLKRHAIDESLVPDQASILFREATLWDQYKQVIIGVALLVVFQTLLIVGLIVNLRHRKLAEQALRQSQRELQTLAGRLISSQEEELSRLSREFHDDYAQRLAALAIEAGTLEIQAERSDSPLRERIVHVKGQLINLSDDIHALSRELHPAILKDLGLERALNALCRNFSDREEIEVGCHFEPVPEDIDPETALCVYRVIQEGLRNIAKHARARHVDIYLQSRGSRLQATIEDDGVGFEPKCARHTPGIGLASMRERVQFVHGEFTVESEPGHGTVIDLSVPLFRGDHEKAKNPAGR